MTYWSHEACGVQDLRWCTLLPWYFWAWSRVDLSFYHWCGPITGHFKPAYNLLFYPILRCQWHWAYPTAYSSWPPPSIWAVTLTRDFTTHSAPTPFGPYILCAVKAIRCTPISRGFTSILPTVLGRIAHEEDAMLRTDIFFDRLYYSGFVISPHILDTNMVVGFDRGFQFFEIDQSPLLSTG